MRQIDADYLGGHPDQSLSCSDGALGAGGALTFTGGFVTSTLQSTSVEFAIPWGEIRAVSVGDPDRMKMLARAVVGAAVAGSLGALVGAATADRNHVLMVAGRRDEIDYFASFGVRGDHGPALIRTIQAGRRERGEDLLPRVEDLAQIETLDAGDRQLLILEDIRALLMEQNKLLNRLTDPTGTPRPGPAA